MVDIHVYARQCCGFVALCVTYVAVVNTAMYLTIYTDLCATLQRIKLLLYECYIASCKSIGRNVLIVPIISVLIVSRFKRKVTVCPYQRPSQSPKAVVFVTKVQEYRVSHHRGAAGSLAQGRPVDIVQEW